MPAAEPRRRVGPERRPYLIGALAGVVVFALVAVLMRSGVTDTFDQRVVTSLAGHRGSGLTDLAKVLDYLDTWWLLGLMIAALLAGLWWSRRMVQAVYLAVCVAIALTLNPLLKLAFDRPRPEDGLVTVSSDAFPSGHTTTATTIATALAIIFWPTRWRWPMFAAAVVFSLAMAGSRVYLGAHWPTDVVGGLALGVTIAMTVRLLMPWPTPEEAAEAQGVPATEEAGPAAGAGPAGTKGIDVVFLDWGNTLMVDNGMREGPMKDWDKVEAETGAQEALLRLRGRYRLIVATNAQDSPAHHVLMALARVGLDECVDDVVSSADVGDHKPNYAFFRAALLREGERGLPLDPRRAVMVGDGTTNDIAGAQRAGIRTIWYNPTKRSFPAGAAQPDAVIKKLAELPATVDRLAGVEPERRSRKQRKADAEAAAAVSAAAAARDLRAASAAEDSAASAAAALPDLAPAEPDTPAPGEPIAAEPAASLEPAARVAAGADPAPLTAAGPETTEEIRLPAADPETTAEIRLPAPDPATPNAPSDEQPASEPQDAPAAPPDGR